VDITSLQKAVREVVEKHDSMSNKRKKVDHNLEKNGDLPKKGGKKPIKSQGGER